ncbi:MAG: hypothetical protein IT361_11760 [Gemmatimonadaceae bacterium]|nr:hypothetical protein [Gemmatimonadaceae bacterium]
MRNIVPGPGGEVQIIDAALGRSSRFSKDGNFLGSTPIRVRGGQGMAAIRLPNGNLLLNERSLPGGGASLVVQQIDKHGASIKRFDDAGPQWRKSWLQHRLLAVRPNGEVLIAHPYIFRIDVYDAALAKRRSLLETAEWIPAENPDDLPSDGVFDQPVAPRLWGLWEGPENHLWTVSTVPSASWRPVRQSRREATPAEFAALERRPRVATLIQVIDLANHRVLASKRFEGFVGSPLSGGYLFALPADSAETSGVEVYRATFKR